jgi:hypothetical protein
VKVVINRCWGGFALSDEAIEAFLNRKSIPWEKTPCKYDIGNSEYWVKGSCEYLDHYEMIQGRNDLDLVAVVEELGDKANGFSAELKVVEIPDDVDWEIANYDGMEHVAEKHRVWR